MRFDFRPSDLIDRVDWDDPDFPAFARMLTNLSHIVELKDENGVSVRSHVITVVGKPADKYGTITGGTITGRLSTTETYP